MKVTKEAIESRIKDVRYIQIPGTTTTLGHITLDNGFSVTGKSAAVDPALFDAAYGRTLAYDDAFRQLYSYLGFLLLEAQHQAKRDLTFGGALKALKEGKAVTRKHFPKDMYLVKVGESIFLSDGNGKGNVTSFDFANALAEDWTVRA